MFVNVRIDWPSERRIEQDAILEQWGGKLVSSMSRWVVVAGKLAVSSEFLMAVVQQNLIYPLRLCEYLSVPNSWDRTYDHIILICRLHYEYLRDILLY